MANYADPTVLSAAPGNRVSALAGLVLTAGIISLALTGFMFFQIHNVNGQTAQIKKVYDSDQDQLASLKPVADQLAFYSQTVSGLHTLFDKQRRWESVLANLEKRLYKKMQVTSLQVDEDGNINFSGIVPDYDSYARVYSSLTDPSVQTYFTNVQPTALAKVDKTGGGTQITFSFKATLAPTILNPATPTSPVAQPTL